MVCVLLVNNKSNLKITKHHYTFKSLGLLINMVFLYSGILKLVINFSSTLTLKQLTYLMHVKEIKFQY